MAEALARHMAPVLPRLIESLAEPGPFTPEARAAGRRALRLALLSLLTRIDDGSRATAAFRAADNMTEQVGALACLLDIGQGQPELAAFEAQWRHDRLVMDKWFSLQILHAVPRQAAALTAQLTKHPAFDWKNPNRFRSVIGAISANHAGFHQPDGAGYRVVADWLIRLDPLNPQTAARMSTAFETLGRYDADRQQLIRAELARMRDRPGISRDLAEMTGRMLGEED
jgi:aminopeptidase N